MIDAIDYQTGKIRWSHEVGPGGSGAGVMTTDSGLTFTGDGHGNVLALATDTGKTLWHAGTGVPMQSSPISYELDGRQYIMTSSGGVLFAWALPEKAAARHILSPSLAESPRSEARNDRQVCCLPRGQASGYFNQIRDSMLMQNARSDRRAIAACAVHGDAAVTWNFIDALL